MIYSESEDVRLPNHALNVPRNPWEHTNCGPSIKMPKKFPQYSVGEFHQKSLHFNKLIKNIIHGKIQKCVIYSESADARAPNHALNVAGNPWEHPNHGPSIKCPK